MNEASGGQEDAIARYWRLIKKIREEPPANISHQLPGLVETLSEEAIENPGAQLFRIGIAFSTNDTLFDYYLERITRPEPGETRAQVVKEPINRDFSYFTFMFPPDPHVDVSAIRGALLTSLIRLARDVEQRDGESNDSGISEVWNLIGRGVAPQD